VKNRMKPVHFITIIFCLFISSQGYAEPLLKEELKTLLEDGNYLFRKATEATKKEPWTAKDLFQKAIVHFERLFKQGGIKNGKLFYNIGNAYFRIGDTGRAILYYKRAKQLIPNDNNLNQNLNYARSKLIDKIEEKEETRIFKIIFFWHYDLSAEIRFAIFIIFYILLWFFAILQLFFKNSIFKWGIIIPSVISILFLGSLSIDAITDAGNNPGVIVADEVIARKGDSDAYEPSFQEPLHNGTEFNVLENRRNWYNIELADGRHCWIPESAIELVRYP